MFGKQIQTQKIWLAFVLLAVLLRGLVPVGYMPDFAAHSGTIAIKICTGDGHAIINVAADKYGKTAPKHTQATPCDYAVNHIFSPVTNAAAILFVALFLTFTGYFFREFGFSQRRYFGAMAARAPPVCA